ncbi:MAG: hypothetical protein HZA53_18315 [Planctomycetes bacterium]|nr:hypothetical protein [Planctomycetota bacterium]
MQHIHRVTGASMRDALLRAQNEFGDDAVVIQQEFAPGGGVTLSIARKTPVAKQAVSTANAPKTGHVRPAQFPAVAPELAVDPTRVPLVREVALRLEKSGASKAFAAKVCSAIRDWPDPDVHVMDRAAEFIGLRFPIAHLKRIEQHTRIVALVGLTGVGKTTTLVKLAARMLRANRRVELATLDSRRVGAVEQARAWSKQLGLPLTVLREGVKPHARAFEGAQVDVVLLDTTGHPPSDVAQLLALKQAFTGTRVAFDVYLVLPATASREALELVTRAYSTLAPEGLVITKLDETRQPAAVLEHALAVELPIAFLTDGPDPSAHLHRSGPEACADLFLRGRIA